MMAAAIAEDDCSITHAAIFMLALPPFYATTLCARRRRERASSPRRVTVFAADADMPFVSILPMLLFYFAFAAMLP